MTSTLFDVAVAAAVTDVFNAKMGTPESFFFPKEIKHYNEMNTVGCPF